MALDWTQLSRYVAKLGDAIAMMKFDKVIKDVGLYLTMESKLNFDGQHSPEGIPWAPFARTPGRRRGIGAKLLRDTGILMASLVSKGLGHVEMAGEHSLEWGTMVDYAQFHQWGTSTIPARPFLGITPKTEDAIGKIVEHHAEKQVPKAA